MGNQTTKAIREDEVFPLNRIYWDGDGNLRHGNTSRNREDEVLQMLQKDSNNEDDPTKLWIIVPSRWIRKWLMFAQLKIQGAIEPGRIDMFSLLVADKTAPTGWRPKNTLMPPSNEFGNEFCGHYRRISLEAWIKILELYDCHGYAIAVRGVPYDDKSRWGLFKNPRLIDVNQLPEPVLPDEEEKEEKKDLTADISSAITGGISAITGVTGLGLFATKKG